MKNSSSPVALLVRSVGNYTSILISGVSTSGYSDETSTSTDDVAQSLLGVCSGEQMTINYSDMRLDSRLTNNAVNDDSVKSALFTAYETADSIFSHATLIKTLQYDSTKGSSAVYNYNYAEDWEKMAIRYITSHMARKYPIRWSLRRMQVMTIRDVIWICTLRTIRSIIPRQIILQHQLSIHLQTVFFRM